MKLLFAFDSGSNCNYLVRMLELQSLMFKNFSYSFIRFPLYTQVNQDDFDVLIYQTFPGENHPFKFNEEMIKQTDEKFWEFKGVKILMDSFDDGEKDAFTRMGEAVEKIPRIKNVPGLSYLEKFNVIFRTLPYLGTDVIETVNNGKRDVILHCAFRVKGYPHQFRKNTMDILHREFSQETKFERVPRRKYPEFLRRTQISITAPGWGPCSTAFYIAIQHGALSFAEETVDRHKMLPRVDLIPGEDYVSFSIDTLADKLRYLLKNPDECDQIRKSGHEKIKEGYNIRESAKEFHQVLEKL